MDRFSKEERSRNMKAIRSKDMKPEMVVRSLIHRMGYRYRLHRKELPGKPDLVFPARNKVIFVHGCFWHQHGSARCKIAHLPKSNLSYWLPKLEKNKMRDKENQKILRKLGWHSLVVWECETKNKDKLRERVRAFLET